MAQDTNDAELGRSKQSSSPRDHLQHLLNLGWDPHSPLVQKYVLANNLQRDLEAWKQNK